MLALLVASQMMGLAGLEVTQVTPILSVALVNPDNVIFQTSFAVETSSAVVANIIPEENEVCHKSHANNHIPSFLPD